MKYRNALERLTRNAKLALIFWAIGTAMAISLAMTSSNNSHELLSSILSDPVTTVGKWTYKDCANHGSREYTFYVDNQAYHGGDGAGVEDCHAIKIGSDIIITYKRGTPKNNFGGNIENISIINKNDNYVLLFPLIWSLLVFMFLVRPHLTNGSRQDHELCL
jgi:hypothetical protein